ncbi:MAG TPA: sigma-70 family RNA polymerase sigma factor [Gemmatimonadaceae bacterium]
MDTRISSSEEVVLVKIVRIARAHAREILPSDDADDLAQDMALSILQRLHAGHPIGKAREAGDLLPTIVKRRALDALRQRERREERDTQYARDYEETGRGVVCPDAEFEEGEWAALRERVLAELPEAVRRAYVLVREEHATYRCAAEELAVSQSSVRWSVSRAQRQLRRGLAALGISVDFVVRRVRGAA